VPEEVKPMIIVTILVAAFAACVVAGGLVLLRAGIAREEADKSLLGEPATDVAAVTRRVVGLYVRKPELAARYDPTSPSRNDPGGHTAKHTRRDRTP
jgi:hypothetical protein